MRFWKWLWGKPSDESDEYRRGFHDSMLMYIVISVAAALIGGAIGVVTAIAGRLLG